MSSSSKILFSVLFLSLMGLGGVLLYDSWKESSLNGPDAPQSTTLEELTSSPTKEATPAGALNLNVPFYTQAPHSNWDYPWQEACEEASVALVANLYLQKNWTLDQFNDQLLALVDWQNEHFGTYKDTTVAQTAEFMEANYGLKSLIHQNPTFEDIQDILGNGHLIIAPFAGKLLYNPNFKNGGPLYHMLVIKGYDTEKQQIVTNDVGTRNGADYVYSWSVLQNALHDWNAEDILKGEKRIIEVIPPSL